MPMIEKIVKAYPQPSLHFVNQLFTAVQLIVLLILNPLHNCNYMSVVSRNHVHNVISSCLQSIIRGLVHPSLWGGGGGPDGPL